MEKWSEGGQMKNRMDFWYEEQQQRIELERVEGCDFWYDAQENLWLATNGTCEPVTGLRALQAVLKRKQSVTIHCHQNDQIAPLSEN